MNPNLLTREYYGIIHVTMTTDLSHNKNFKQFTAKERLEYTETYCPHILRIVFLSQL
jgi:hypothetical protein